MYDITIKKNDAIINIQVEDLSLLSRSIPLIEESFRRHDWKENLKNANGTHKEEPSFDDIVEYEKGK